MNLRGGNGSGRVAGSALALAVILLAALASRAAWAAEVVALGASNTQGQGVAPDQAFPAQIEAMLRAKGLNISVANAGIGGDTTAGMLGRFDSVVDSSTRVLILQPGGNDARRHFTPAQTEANVAQIRAQATARHIKVVMVQGSLFKGLPFQADGMHLTAEGYHRLAIALLPQVLRALRK